MSILLKGTIRLFIYDKKNLKLEDEGEASIRFEDDTREKGEIILDEADDWDQDYKVRFTKKNDYYFGDTRSATYGVQVIFNKIDNMTYMGTWDERGVYNSTFIFDLHGDD